MTCTALQRGVLTITTATTTGMSDMYILFGLMMTLLAVTHVVSHVKFQYWPTSVKLFSASLVLRAVSLACGAIHFCALGINGTGSPFFESVGTCVGIVASFSAFVWAGWIATGGLNSARPGLTTLAVAFLILNFCSYVGLFAWYELGRAPWSTDYVFDSGFGVVKKTNAVCCVCVIATTFPRSRFHMTLLSSPSVCRHLHPLVWRLVAVAAAAHVQTRAPRGPTDVLLSLWSVYWVRARCQSGL